MSADSTPWPGFEYSRSRPAGLSDTEDDFQELDYMEEEEEEEHASHAEPYPKRGWTNFPRGGYTSFCCSPLFSWVQNFKSILFSNVMII